MLSVKELNKICEALPPDIKAALSPTFANIEKETETLEYLRKHPKFKSNLNLQKAFRQMNQTFQQDIKIVLWQLRQNETSTADELMKRLAEFE